MTSFDPTAAAGRSARARSTTVRADHLVAVVLPDVTLPATDGRSVRLTELGPGRTVIYAYPMTGTPGVEPPDGWDEIPGARGCTPESCGFRDHHAELDGAGAAVLGLSTQPTDVQREAAERLGLPFALLSDAGPRADDRARAARRWSSRARR